MEAGQYSFIVSETLAAIGLELTCTSIEPGAISTLDILFQANAWQPRAGEQVEAQDSK